MTHGSRLQKQHASWFAQLLSFEGGDLFCEVDADFIADNFNLVGIRESGAVGDYDAALSVVTGRTAIGTAAGGCPDKIEALIIDCVQLYGLVHARFLLTGAGQRMMADKMRRRSFGVCPRVLCAGAPVLPVGIDAGPRRSVLRAQCSECRDVYKLRRARHTQWLDGAFWGSTYANMLLLQTDAARPRAKLATNTAPPAPQVRRHKRRVFGFRLARREVKD